MIATTFNGEDVYLLPYQADWSVNPTATFSLQADGTRSNDGREGRRAYAYSTITTATFTLFLLGDEKNDFNIALRRLENTRVLCPYWPSSQLVSDAGTPPFTTGIWLIAEPDLSDWEVNETGEASSFTPSSEAFVVPLMLGVFKTEPAPVATSSDKGTTKIEFIEAGDASFALTPAASDGDAGPALPTGQVPKVFPCLPNWAREPDAGQAHFELSRKQVGFGREQAETYYPQPASRVLQFGFTQISQSAIAQLIYFFWKREATVGAFWLPGATDECVLTSATVAADPVIHVDRAAGIGDNVWLAVIVRSTQAVLIRKVVSRDVGANTITLDTALPVYQPGAIRIVAAVLARFKKSDLQLTYVTTEYAEAVVAFMEAPNEYTLPAGETLGTTLGGLARKAFLFRFTRVYPGGTISNRFTSYERPITLAGTEVFQKDRSIVISHGDIFDSLEPDKTTVAISSQAFAGNPLLLFLPNQLEAPLYLEILECTPDSSGAAATARQLFYGTVRQPQLKGPSIEAQVVHILSELGRNIPRYIIQPTCNYRLFSPPCGLLESDFTYEEEVTAIDGNLLTITVGSAFAAAYFAFGRTWFGAGETYQSRSIYDSTASSSGHLTLVVEKPFKNLTVGDTINVSPGCDKLVATCRDKFANYPGRNGSMPFVPPGNPTFVKVVQNETSGGKK